MDNSLTKFINEHSLFINENLIFGLGSAPYFVSVFQRSLT